MIPAELLRKVRQIQLRTRNVVTDVFAGQYHSVFKGQGMEFHEVREYVPGDDIRAIDWNVTARMGHPFIKKFVEERELTVMLLVDISGSQGFGSRAQLKRDLAAELAAVLAFAAIRNNDRVGLILFGGKVEHAIPPRKGVRHVLRVVRDVLVQRPAGRGTSLAAALEFLGRIAHRKTVTFVISDFRDAGFERALAVAAKRHDVVALVTADRRERAWTGAGVVEFEDAETGRRVLVDTSSREAQRVIADQHRRHAERLKFLFRKSAIDAIDVTAGEPYEREFVRFFRARERRLGV